MEIFLKQIPSIKERKDEDLCYRNSLIYLAIGQANNIPLYGTITQGAPQQDHIFIRYDPDGKHDPLNSNNSINKEDINIETTTGEIQENQKEYSQINIILIPKLFPNKHWKMEFL